METGPHGQNFNMEEKLHGEEKPKIEVNPMVKKFKIASDPRDREKS